MATTQRSEEDTVAERARKAIRERNFTQRKVAELIGMDETKLSKSLAGQRQFTGTELLVLAENTGVDVAWLRDGATGGQANGHSEPSKPGESFQRRRILQSAWELFATHGYDAVRLSDIAAAAGVSSPTVLYHFGNKNAVFQACLDFSTTLNQRRREEILNADMPALQKLYELVAGQLPRDADSRLRWSIWAQFWGANPISVASQQTHERSYSQWRVAVWRVLAEGQARGEFRDGPLEAMVDTLTGLIDGLGVRILARMMSPERAEELIFDQVRITLMRPDQQPTGSDDE